jgi:hypothetical protein
MKGWRGDYRPVFTLALLALAGGILLRGALYPLLARQAPVESDILVVEGWLVDNLLEQAADWAESNGVQKIYTTGGPVDLGSHLAEWKDYATMTKARLVALGLGERFEIEAVPAKLVTRGRTRASARALKAALGLERGAFNLASEGPHTRRSWRAFQGVFGEGVAVGSVALTPVAFGENDWWRYSEGVRSVVGESIAYGYDVLAGGGGTPRSGAMKNVE